MTVAFFIGHHKTGSTALQTYLATNYLTLLREGILYPAVDAEGSASNLAAALKGADDQVDHSRMNVREPHNALAFRLLNEANEFPVPNWHPNLPQGFQMLHLIEAQIAALNPKHVVICSEVMSRFAEKGWRKTLPRLQNRFGERDCTIVLNLRRIDEYLASWHLQRLKFGTVIKPLRQGAHETYYAGVHFRFDQIVDRWSKAFPDARMRVRNYDDVMASGGSVQDFFTQAGIDYLPAEANDRLNTSIPYAMAEIVRQANIQIPDDCRRVLNYVLDAMKRVPYAPNAEVELYGPIHRPAMAKAFAPVHKSLSAHVGLDGFFPDMAEAETCRPMPEIEAATAALDALQNDVRDRTVPDVVKSFIANLKLED